MHRFFRAPARACACSPQLWRRPRQILIATLITCAGLGAGSASAQAGPGGVSAGLTAWYDAASNVANSGTTTTVWGCKVAGCTVAVLTNQPDGSTGTQIIGIVPNAMNFNPALNFAGRGFMGGPANFSQDDITAAAAGSAFAVGGSGSDQVIFLGRGVGSTGTCNPNRCDVGTRATLTNFGSTTAGLGAIGSAIYLGVDGPTANLYGLWASVSATPGQSNTRNGWTNTGTAVSKQPFTDYQLRIGSFPGFAYTGNIPEVAYYNRQVTAVEAQRISSYFAIKYGITLDSDGTRNNATNFDYLSSAGTLVWSGTGSAQFQPYHNDVFGVGRDLASSLDQRLSTSVNNSGPVATYPPDILTLATSALSSPSQFVYTLQTNAAGTAAGAGAQLADQQYLMVGNDAGSADTATAITVAGNTTAPAYDGNWTRLTRRWRAQNSGAVGTVSVMFTLSAAGIAALGGNLANVVLLVDDDGNYTNGATRIVTTGRAVSGNQISFNVNLSNAEIFTLASATATLVVQKTTILAAGTYGFTTTNATLQSGSNSITLPANATNAVVGTFAINAINAPLTVMENSPLPANIYLASMACTNASAGGTTFSPTYDVPGKTATVPAASVNAGAQITCTFSNVQNPDIAIKKRDTNGGTYTPGGSNTYILSVTNNGGPAAGMSVSDVLPKGITLSAPWTCTPAAYCSAGCTVSGANCTGNAPATPFAGNAATNVLSGLLLSMPANSSVTISLPVTYANSAAAY